MAKVLTSHMLSIPLEIWMTNCYIFSILMYSAEAWTLTKPLEKNLEAFKMWCMRTIVRVGWKEIEVLWPQMTQRRHHSNNFRKGMDGRRPRGRPRQTWLNNIIQWTGGDARRSIAEARNCHMWSVITHQPLDRRWDDTSRYPGIKYGLWESLHVLLEKDCGLAIMDVRV